LKTSQFFKRGNRRAFFTRAFFAGLALVGAAALSVSAQSGAMSPYQGESDGVSAGGKWLAFRSEDKMTGAKRVRFELMSDNYLSEDPDYKPRIELVCTNNKYTSADFNPGIRLGPPDRPGFWGQPQMQVLVRVDDTHNSHGWNWNRDRFLSMDKGTTRELIGARVFKVEIPGRRGPEIAEFSPAGLDLVRVRQACDLTPRKPSKD
jgi:dipeptidyl aminopeptidase/acylaminoacyl peptidase